MTAREMFEQKDFECGESRGFIVYQKKYKDTVVMELIFDKYIKAVFVSGCKHAVMLDCELLKAINRQCKELGWFDE